jgi:hypothetical protein
MFWGTILVIFGLAFLLKNLGFISGGVWDIAWPLLVIVFGVSLLSHGKCRLQHLPWCNCGDCNKTNQ